jgi:hypothetical protein
MVLLIGYEVAMRYEQFSSLIVDELKKKPEGMSWRELKTQLDLPYKTPCYTWIYKMEAEMGLSRRKGPRGMIWKVK